MKKISTVFKKDPNNLGRVVNEVSPENEWALKGEGVATRKFDGTAVAVIEGVLYKRYDAKKGKKAPENAIPCQEADPITGHHPHWVRCDSNKPEDKYFFEAYNPPIKDGTYELVGEKINGNPEKVKGHCLIRHGSEILYPPSLDFEDLRNYLFDPNLDIEGIVFHHKTDGRMCKLRKSDFGIKRK